MIVPGSAIRLGRYILFDRIAVGGMAEVYKAKSFGADGFDRIVAVKRILQSLSGDEEFIRMFRDEASIASRLTHHNVVQIYDFDEQAGTHFIAMEYVSGRNLRVVLDRLTRQGRAVEPPMACYLLARLCEALDYAHKRKDAQGRSYGIIHRDVTPQNVLLSFEGEVKLCDFGIAKAMTQSARTQTGVLKGKFAYMSPEQIRAEPVDSRSDLFSLGVIAHEMLSGRRLFLGPTDYATLEAIRSMPIPSLVGLGPDVTEELDALVMRLLARDPADRYQSAAEVFHDVTGHAFSARQNCSARELRQFMHVEFAAEIEQEKKSLAELAAFRLEDVPHAFESAAARPAEPVQVQELLDATVLSGAATEIQIDHLPPLESNTPIARGTTPRFVSQEYTERDLVQLKSITESDESVSATEVDVRLGRAANNENLAESVRVVPTAGDTPTPAGLPMPIANEMIARPSTASVAPTKELEPKLARNASAAATFSTLGNRENRITIRTEGRQAATRLKLAFVVLLLSLATLVALVARQLVLDASLRITTTPPTRAQIILDGKVVSLETPAVVSKIATGIHTIEVRADGFRSYQQTFEIARRRAHLLTITLETDRPAESPTTRSSSVSATKSATAARPSP